MLPGLALLSACRFGFGAGEERAAREDGYVGRGDFPDTLPDDDGDDPDGAVDLEVDAGAEPIVVPPVDAGSDAASPPEDVPDAGAVEPDAGVVLPPLSSAVLFSGSSSTGLRGGTGGSAFSENCPASHVIAGYQGFVSSDPSRTWVMRIQALCARVSIEGELATNVTLAKPVALFEHGTDGNIAWQRVCPKNQQVTGFTGRGGSFLDEIVLSCAPILVSGSSGSYTLSLGSSTTLAPVGGGGGGAFAPANCPSGQVARGHQGRSGQWVDALGLVCGVPQVE
jgi:hypothetical protein